MELYDYQSDPGEYQLNKRGNEVIALMQANFTPPGPSRAKGINAYQNMNRNLHFPSHYVLDGYCLVWSTNRGGMIQTNTDALDADGMISDTEILDSTAPSENWIRTRTANSHQMVDLLCCRRNGKTAIEESRIVPQSTFKATSPIAKQIEGISTRSF